MQRQILVAVTGTKPDKSNPKLLLLIYFWTKIMPRAIKEMPDNL